MKSHPARGVWIEILWGYVKCYVFCCLAPHGASGLILILPAIMHWEWKEHRKRRVVKEFPHFGDVTIMRREELSINFPRFIKILELGSKELSNFRLKTGFLGKYGKDAVVG